MICSISDVFCLICIINIESFQELSKYRSNWITSRWGLLSANIFHFPNLSLQRIFSCFFPTVAMLLLCEQLTLLASSGAAWAGSDLNCRLISRNLSCISSNYNGNTLRPGMYLGSPVIVYSQKAEGIVIPQINLRYY